MTEELIVVKWRYLIQVEVENKRTFETQLSETKRSHSILIDKSLSQITLKKKRKTVEVEELKEIN